MLFRSRGLDGLKMGTHDNDAHFCNAACPRCRELAPAAQYATLFQSLLNAADAAQLHRPDFDYVLYTWWWGKDAVDSVANLMGNRRVTVLSRSTQKLPQYWKGKELGRVFDLALGVEGISREFLTETAAAHRRGWAMTDMTAFGHAFEYFWLPYTPAPHRVAERIAHLRAAGAAAWFDYDCGGIYPGINAEIIRHDSPEPQNLVERTLTTLYPAEEIAGAKAAYELAEAALAARPIAFNTDDIMNLSGRGMFELSIALPFEPTDITLLDQGHRVFFFAPANFLTPSSIPTLREMFTASADLWQRASDRIAMLRGQGTWAQAGLPWEKKVFRAHALATASACRYIEMGSYRLARARGEMTPAEECSRLLPLLRAELVAAEEFAGLWRQDRRLLDNPHWRLPRFVQACIPWVTIDQTDPFTTKLTHTRAKIASLERGTGLDAVPLWGAGNARSR